MTEATTAAEKNERLRILWVEDDADDLRLGSRVARETMDIDAVDTCAGAEERLRTSTYNAVVLDMHLLNGKGPDVFRRVHPLVGPAALMVLTGHRDKEMAADLQARGADLVFYKGDANPAGLAQLIEQLALRVKRERQRREVVDQLRMKVRRMKAVVVAAGR